jgi:hypothetical protein
VFIVELKQEIVPLHLGHSADPDSSLGDMLKIKR